MVYIFAYMMVFMTLLDELKTSQEKMLPEAYRSKKRWLFS